MLRIPRIDCERRLDVLVVPSVPLQLHELRSFRFAKLQLGASLHAARRVEADDRAGLEQLCSYVTRPPLAAGSLEKVSDDKFVFKMKCSWSDGTSHIILPAHELLESFFIIVQLAAGLQK